MRTTGIATGASIRITTTLSGNGVSFDGQHCPLEDVSVQQDDQADPPIP